MSAQFAIDPALASGNSTNQTPTTASPANLTKPASPPKNQGANPNPAHYSIFPTPPPLPGWGPFPSPLFGHLVPVPVPTFMPHPPPWPDQPQPQPQHPQPQPHPKTPSAHYQNPSTSTSTTSAGAKPRPKRRLDPPPINPAAVLSPHYQNPGGFGGVYTPPQPTAASSSSSEAAVPSDDHYAHSKSSHPAPLTTLTSSGRQFACGQPGCTAAFDRKSDCERHRRTHVKATADARPFKCSRPGCEAAFDRKDALMRHERNERTHLVRQTQPGRPRRISKNDPMIASVLPRRQSTRKRKSLLPSTADLYASEDDDEYDNEDEDDDDDDLDRSKRARMSSLDEHDLVAHESGSGLGVHEAGSSGLGGHDNGSGLGGHDHGSGMDSVGSSLDHLVVVPDQLVIDPQLHGLGESVGVEETMQAVEAIQAALQQIEADADAEKRAG